MNETACLQNKMSLKDHDEEKRGSVAEQFHRGARQASPAITLNPTLELPTVLRCSGPLN